MSGNDFARSLISALGVRHVDLYLDKVSRRVGRLVHDAEQPCAVCCSGLNRQLRCLVATMCLMAHQDMH